jgi:hypothetical protein
MAGRIGAVGTVTVVCLALPPYGLTAGEASDAASKIAATQTLLDSVIYDKTAGTIKDIDLERNTFQIKGKTFSASPTNTVGAKLSDLKEGDKITVQATDLVTEKQPINVMILEKAE